MRSVVAVSVKDEEERIGNCLSVILRQSMPAHAVVLVVNNTSDQTLESIRDVAAGSPVAAHTIDVTFPAERASAGAARRMAMERAADLAGEGGVVLTTDADGRVPLDWIERNLFYLRNGVDAVAGRATLDPADQLLIPARLLEDDALELAYAAALDEIASIVRPTPWDPWPRHTEHSGASIAATVAAYRRAGGMPASHVAEDRKVFVALEAVGARVRLAPEIAVTVSGRTVGRAEGGMADTIRRRLRRSDPFLDDALEPALDFYHRLLGTHVAARRLVPAPSAAAELAIARAILSGLARGGEPSAADARLLQPT